MFGVALFRQDGVHINGPNTSLHEFKIDLIEGEGVIEYMIPTLPLLDGQYLFSAAVYDRYCDHAYDHHHMRYQFTILPGGVKERYGLVHIPAQWEHRQAQ